MTLRSLDTDYIVVGAGATGMAFTDALVDHADVHVTLVDRRHVLITRYPGTQRCATSPQVN
jgi:NADH dehydrogenase FAD-containing subunit